MFHYVLYSVQSFCNIIAKSGIQKWEKLISCLNTLLYLRLEMLMVRAFWYCDVKWIVSVLFFIFCPLWRYNLFIFLRKANCLAVEGRMFSLSPWILVLMLLQTIKCTSQSASLAYYTFLFSYFQELLFTFFEK